MEMFEDSALNSDFFRWYNYNTRLSAPLETIQTWLTAWIYKELPRAPFATWPCVGENKVCQSFLTCFVTGRGGNTAREVGIICMQTDLRGNTHNLSKQCCSQLKLCACVCIQHSLTFSSASFSSDVLAMHVASEPLWGQLFIAGWPLSRCAGCSANGDLIGICS